MQQKPNEEETGVYFSGFFFVVRSKTYASQQQ